MTARRVLLLDDSTMNAEIVQMVLSLEGFEVLVARSAAEAHELTVDGVPEIGLIDVRVPGAFDLLDRLKAVETIPPAVLVALVSYDALPQSAALLDAGFDDCLPKPINTRALPGILRDHLTRRACG